MATLDRHALHCAFFLCHYLPFFFQEIRPGPFLRLAAEVHCDFVGLQAG